MANELDQPQDYLNGMTANYVGEIWAEAVSFIVNTNPVVVNLDGMLACFYCGCEQSMKLPFRINHNVGCIHVRAREFDKALFENRGEGAS